MTRLFSMLVLVAGLAAASPVAASVLFDFSGNSADSSSKTFTVDGLTVTVTAGTISSGDPATIDFSTRKVDQKHDGLGADGPLDQDEVDNVGKTDILVFSFEHLVKIESIGFKQALIGGNYLFGTVLGNSFDILGGMRSAVNGLNTVNPESPFAFAFGISAPQGCFICTFGEFRIEQLEVSKVPLPAGVLLLGLGLGGLAAYRRRQAA